MTSISQPLHAPVLAWYTQSALPNAFLQRRFNMMALQPNRSTLTGRLAGKGKSPRQSEKGETSPH